jgi:RNA polymerase sigma-70 factor, ECF subfamily
MAMAAEELVLAAQRGSSGAFAELIHQHERTALAIAYAITGDAHAAGDAVQEAFLRAWQRLNTLAAPASFPSWLAGIVQNQARDCLRAVRRRERHESAVPDLPESPALADPAEGMQRDETHDELHAAIGRLDELSRIAVALRYFQGLTAGQIGDLLGLSAAAVDMRLSRARRQLKQLLEPEPAAPAAKE